MRIMRHVKSSTACRIEKRELSNAVSMALRVGSAAAMLAMSPTVLSQSGFGAVVELSDLDGSDGFVLNGIGTYNYSGISVSGAGDINGEGVDDLIIGASYASPNGSVYAGDTYVVFGGSSVGNTGTIELSDLDGLSLIHI